VALTKYIEDKKLKIDENEKDKIDEYIKEWEANESNQDIKDAVEKLKTEWILIPA
jgi:2-polyprenyl-3-methyl-5-hydroxy-6-metoxy-1,4-benzoquinol methylase